MTARPAARSVATGVADERAAVPADVLMDLHLRMVRIRVFEEVAGQLMESGRLPGALHLYVGQEAVAAGVCAALRRDDQITSTHRGHGHFIAKGGSFDGMFAELFGRTTGACRGKGGSMHISDLTIGILGANGIVGAGVPIAVGAAFANRYLDSDRVAVSFFGDGASDQGALFEAANMAALWRLPCILVCENNGYAEFTAQRAHQAIDDIAQRAVAWGMAGVVVDGMDVRSVWTAAVDAAARARGGEGPTLIEAKTYRFYDHVGVKGMRIPYRTTEEVASWIARDPIATLEAELADIGLLTDEAARAIRAEIESEAERAVAAAEVAPVPEASDLLADVFTEDAR
jgi:TPP-dependent pyruvate/acetoin dehydrogenase alpha subunit